MEKLEYFEEVATVTPNDPSKALIAGILLRNRIIAALKRMNKSLASITQRESVEQSLLAVRDALCRSESELHLYDFPFDEEEKTVRLIAPELMAVAGEIEPQIQAWQQNLWVFWDRLATFGNYLTQQYLLKNNSESFVRRDIRKPTKEESSLLKKLNRQLLFSEVVLRNFRPQAVPLSINVDPSSFCNCRCKTCFQAFTQRFHHSVLSIEVVEKLQEAFSLADEVRLFGGGEPTLSPGLARICEIVAATGTWTEILTNGSTLGRRELPLEKLQSIGISIDGACKRTFDAIRRGLSFEDLIGRVKNLRAEDRAIHLYFNVTVSRINLDELEAIALLAVDLGISHINFTKMLPEYTPLKPFELKAQDRTLLESELQKAKQVCAANGITFSDTISGSHFPDEDQPRIKEELMRDMEQLQVQGPVVTTSPEEMLSFLQSHDISGYPSDHPCFERLQRQQAFHSSELDESTYAWLSMDKGVLEGHAADLKERIRQLPDSAIAIPHCLEAWVKLFVTATGSLRSCCVLPQEVGDIEIADGFDLAWHSGMLERIRRGTFEADYRLSNCIGCRHPARYHMLELFLAFLVECGKDLGQIGIPEDFNPPDWIREQYPALFR